MSQKAPHPTRPHGISLSNPRRAARGISFHTLFASESPHHRLLSRELHIPMRRVPHSNRIVETLKSKPFLVGVDSTRIVDVVRFSGSVQSYTVVEEQCVVSAVVSGCGGIFVPLLSSVPTVSTARQEDYCLYSLLGLHAAENVVVHF